MNRILVLFAHPAFQKSRANKVLIDAYRDMENLTFRDLYEEYPDFNIDVGVEQQLLVESDIVIFHHPMYWYSCPALLKEWLDLVLEFGFAFGRGGTALEGKLLLTVITTGGSQEAYREEGHNRFSIGEFLIPFEQTAILCGMQYLPPFVAFGMHARPRIQTMEEHAARLRQILIALRDKKLEVAELRNCRFLHQALKMLEDSGSSDANAR